MAWRVPLTITFNNGVKCPILGFGTWRLHGKEAYDSVKTAIKVGYRHVDTAFSYENEKEVGQAINDAISEGAVKREDVFVVSKLSSANHKEGTVVPALRKTLENLNLSYLDMFLIHAPWSTKPITEGQVCLKSEVNSDGKDVFDDVDIVDTWRGMEECVRLGLARCIGVSNFNAAQTDSILKSCGIKPVTNQVELHHHLSQEKLRKFSEERELTLTAYRSLGGPKNIDKIMGDEKISNLAKKYDRSPAQIIIRWILQRGIIALVKSSTPRRIEENLDVFNFEISAEDMEFLSSTNTNTRYCQFLDVTNAKYFPFADGVEY